MKKLLLVIILIGSSFELIVAQQNKIEDTGDVGIGTTSPRGALHISSPSTQKSSVGNVDANLIIQGNSGNRNIDQGASLGFVLPANTDGTNFWQQGRLLVTPDNDSNGNANGRMYLQTRYLNSGGIAWAWRDNIVLRSSGEVGIGTSNPDMELTVKGDIHAEEVKIDLNVPVPDYVFKKDYNLRSIEDVERFISKNSHLPEIPSAKDFEEDGIMQGEMDMNLLKKIEELTLYTIQQQKEIERLKLIEKRLAEIEKLLESKK